MDPQNRNQEYLVGVYRNAVQPLPWLADATEAAKVLGPRVHIHDATKIRVHLLSMGELDNADVASSGEAEDVAKRIEERVHPSFHTEMEVLFNGLALVRMENTDKRALIVPVSANNEIDGERRTAIDTIPWTHDYLKPRVNTFQYRLRIGTIYSPDIEEKTIIKTLIGNIPKRAIVQKGKIKTLE